MIFDFLKAFVCGGLICVVGQILIDKTKLTSARILVLFVVAGCILGGIGVYEPFVNFAGCGATTPLPGFGYLLAKGVKEEIDNSGAIGIFTGGLKSSAGGISAAILAGLFCAVVFQPKSKK
ncbi:MAG: stage V sporulation protein AE [Clostridiales bacterium]|jgi:stage V sporulation protein AE|nr:stage V sporulation protein AE [Clostridiales bacterium]